MKILVCIKQVPDSSETLELNPSTGWITYNPFTVFRMNRFDEYALEEALQLREQDPGTSVHALSVGPERVSSTLRRAMEMGSDCGVHLLMQQDEYISPVTVASAIASYARTRGYDLIITGVMAEDDMACMTGQLVAAILDLPSATSVIRVDHRTHDGSLEVDREIEGGTRISLLMDLPAVITVQSGINIPRYPSLSNVLRARSQPLELVRIEDLDIVPVRESCSGVKSPDSSIQGVYIDGTLREKALWLKELLHERAFLP
ncbi:MAG TPA: electron transfer flavoprotein subunit beta/FixA family protein [Deltaproteobacteria bacterium]|nr:electron transfer flavoprotein subunit beta/FixA family protein [Deltaproteobacteria bacterium]HPR53895.1 electron transfer flavoprotein subunit beta/FixA family protein [Deltaproteobacteria bacterium]HXK46695.1 electron transfer flavoprotein subunit beta/FixA family protein [Deltaproteobacteria bacterium]